MKAGAGSRPPNLSERRAYYRAALAFARRARRAVLTAMARGFRKRLKADATYVTTADLRVERVLRAAIARRFPQHGIVGEEFPEQRPGAAFRWFIDPIDGTLSFTHGIPFFGTILALHWHDIPLLGVIDHPALGLCYSAARGLGAWRNGHRIRIRDLPRGSSRSREVIATGDRPTFVECGRARAFDRLMRLHPRVRGYTDCLGHTLAAEGAVGAMVDYGLKRWDLAATQVLIEEAGGRYECLYRSRRNGQELFGIVCGKPRVVAWVRRLFR